MISLSIHDFVAERYDELAAIARAAGGEKARWRLDCRCEGTCEGWGSCSRRVECDATGMTIYDEGGHDSDDANHMVTFDPAAMTPWIAANREILQLHRSCADEPECHVCGPYGSSGACLTMLLLAKPFREHADFRPEWAIG